MESCDVLIVGGGPAGSSCAWGLRDSGLDVLVLDRKPFPRDKTCAGWVTPQALDGLAIDRELYAKERVLQPIRGFRVSRIGDAAACARYPAPVSFGVRRCEFDHFLIERCGARLRLGAPLVRLERRKGSWLLNDAIESPLVIGAGGHFCPIGRRQSAVDSGPERIVAAQEVEFRLEASREGDCPVDPEIPEIFFTRDLRGYGWIFRKGPYLNVGLGRQDRRGLSDHVRDFLAFLRDAGRLPERMPESLQGHAYLLYGQAPRRLVADGLMLVGDAAGLAYPRSGEGIRPAIESGLLAARTIVAAGGEYQRSRLVPYARALESRFGSREPRRRVGWTDLLPGPLAGRLAGRLLGTPWFVRNVVVDRWFVHADQPALAPAGPV